MTPSRATWERAIAAAVKGDARPLLELLLQPIEVDSRDEPAVRDDGFAFYQLPDDQGLRVRIVRALIFGNLNRAGTVERLFTHTFGANKPAVQHHELLALKLAGAVGMPVAQVDALADKLGVDAENVPRLLATKRRKRKE